jgi:Superinfection immunity protein
VHWIYNMEGFLFWLMIAIIYFIPAFMANGRKNGSAIFALNLLLGWTLLGWVGALVWALASPKEPVKDVQGPLNNEDKLTPCHYCKTLTKSIYNHTGGFTSAAYCAECGNLKG